VTLHTLLQHRREERVHPVDDTEHVHIEAPPPVVEVVLPDRPLGARADAGVVAQQVDRAVSLERRVAELLDRLERSHVGDDAGHVAPVVAQLSSGALDEIGDDVGDHGLHALGAEPFDERATDPLSGAGDDRDLAGELLHRVCSFGMRWVVIMATPARW